MKKVSKLKKLDEPVSIPIERQKFCKRRGGQSQCRFFVLLGGWGCCAKESNLQSTIESLVLFIKAKGDNCSGPPDFKPT